MGWLEPESPSLSLSETSDRGSSRPVFLTRLPGANSARGEGYPAPSAAQCILRIAGDPLVAFGQGDQFVAADDIVDSGERLVVGALEHLAQDRVGRIGAVGQNDAGGGFEPLSLIRREGCNGIAVFEQRRGERARVQNRLAGAVGA